MTAYTKIKLVGKIYREGKLLKREQIEEKLCSLAKDDTNLALEARKWTGNFSITFETPDTLYAIVDQKRSFPILVNFEKCEIHSQRITKENLRSFEIDYEQFKSFYFSGYTLGDRTMAKNILSIPAGHIYIINKKTKKIKRKKYFSFFPSNKNRSDEQLDDYLHKFDRCYRQVFGQLIENANGRPIVIPLSAGYDSRLVLLYLKKLKYDNIQTFSYGNRDFWELDFAKRVAEKSKVRWYRYTCTPSDRRLFYQPSVQNFYWASFNLEQVPQMNDYYAIDHLITSRVISRDSVIVNGQSGDFIDGGHLPDYSFTTGRTQDLMQAIKVKHFSLWKCFGDSKIETSFLKKQLEIFVDELSSHIRKNPNGFYEQFEYLHRQTKFVVNGQRVYDHFKLDWELPFWDPKIMEFWMDVPIDLRFDRRLTKYVAQKLDMNGLFSIPTKPKAVWKHVPILVRFLQYIDAKIDNKLEINERIANFYNTYSSLYPVVSFSEYRRISRGHKNSYSFHTDLICKEINK